VSPRGFDFIWASPPCQHYCALKTMLNRRQHPDLIAPVRVWLKKFGKPWVIENVFGAPLNSAAMLCGSHFNLTAYGYQLRRHRYFEASFLIVSPGVCKHADKTQGIYGAKVRDIALEKRHYAKPKATRGKPIGVVLPHKYGFEAMQIDWMNIRELSECIPPAYSEYVLRQYKKSLGSQVYNSPLIGHRKLFCDRPDVHLPRMLCNRPLPCKFHGGQRGRVAHFEDHPRVAAPRWLLASRPFGIRIGPRWRAVAEKFLPLLP
jgi:DNA (cytosine-5)-methyltransferase 1